VRWLTLRPMMSYSTDLSDAEFEHIEEHLPTANQRGRPKIHPPREILNAIFYVLKSGCPWRLLPREFPPWRSVYHWFRAWRIDGTVERLNALSCGRLYGRDSAGTPSPVQASWTPRRSKPLAWEALSAASTPPSKWKVESDTYSWTPRGW
jgi:transposase